MRGAERKLAAEPSASLDKTQLRQSVICCSRGRFLRLLAPARDDEDVVAIKDRTVEHGGSSQGLLVGLEDGRASTLAADLRVGARASLVEVLPELLVEFCAQAFRAEFWQTANEDLLRRGCPLGLVVGPLAL